MIFRNKSTSVNGIIGLSIYHCIRFPVEEEKIISKWDELQYRKMVFKLVKSIAIEIEYELHYFGNSSVTHVTF